MPNHVQMLHEASCCVFLNDFQFNMQYNIHSPPPLFMIHALKFTYHQYANEMYSDQSLNIGSVASLSAQYAIAFSQFIVTFCVMFE